MGNKEVGKTSIINAYIQGSSQKFKSFERTNVITDFHKAERVTDKNGNQHTLQLNIWDAAGDANVHNLAHLFLKDVNCCILVYSIDNKNSFDQLQEWAEHLENSGNEYFLVVVGNKSDLEEHRAVPQTFATQLKKILHNCKFTIETSSFEDMNSIRSLFEQVTQFIVNDGFYQKKA